MFHLFLNDLKILKKNWMTLLMLFIVSMTIGLILIKAMSPIFEKNIFLKNFSIGVVDYDKSMVSKMAISNLESEGYISRVAKIAVIDEKQAINKLKAGTFVCVVIIPQGFAQSLYLGENKPVKVYVNGNGTTTKLAESFFSNAADLVTASQSGIYTVYHMMLKSEVGREDAYRIAEKTIPDFILLGMGRQDVFETITVSNLPEIGVVRYYIVCVSVMLLIFTGIFGLRLINQDLESNVIIRILISPEGIFRYIIEKTIVMVMIGFVEFIAVMIPFSVYFKASFPILNMKVIITVIAIILSSTSLCILISVLSKSSATAVTSSIIILFILCMVGGCIYPSAIMSDWMKTVSDYVLSSWALEGMFWSLADAPITRLAEIWRNLFAFTAVMILFSTIAFGRGRFKLLYD